MGLEIRAAKPEEMDEFSRVINTALLSSPEISREVRPEWTLCAFEDGKLATTYAAWPLTMRFNGEGISVAGVTSVGTLPIYRRGGYLRKVTATHFQLLHERGERPIAILNASRAAIYQRYGYAVVSVRNSYNVEPRYLEFPLARPVPGNIREAGDDEFELLVDLYRRFRTERIGYVHRGRAMWEAGVLAPPPAGGLMSKVIYEEAGEPLGYVIYTVETLQRTPQIFRLAIRDLIWLKASAYQAVWNYFAHMDLVGNIIWERVPSDDPLPHLLLEPRMLHTTSYDGILARIVDVEQALSKRRYSEEGTLTFEILDDLCSWNRGRWKLETSAAEASISRTSEEPELVMPISTLAMLVFGQISATEAARMQRLDVLKASALSTWDRVIRTAYRPFCADLF
ncbi:enhanced intracellular survival protein Eis [Chloroflexota bacterium]